jgi:hypothetical protein
MYIIMKSNFNSEGDFIKGKIFIQEEPAEGGRAKEDAISAATSERVLKELGEKINCCTNEINIDKDGLFHGSVCSVDPFQSREYFWNWLPFILPHK